MKQPDLKSNHGGGAGVDLTEAARSGDEEAVATLLALNSDEKYVSEALCAAAEGGHAKVVNALLAAGAKANYQSASGLYPLRSAIAGGDGDCIQALLDGGADPNLETSRGTPLTAAASAGDVSTCELLVKKGAVVDAVTQSSGVTALMVASREDQREVVKALLALGADPNLPSATGMSAIDLATAKGHAEVASLLLQASIVRGVDQEIKASDDSLIEARVSRDAASVKARSELQREMESSRAEKEVVIKGLKEENEQLMAKLGLGGSRAR